MILQWHPRALGSSVIRETQPSARWSCSPVARHRPSAWPASASGMTEWCRESATNNRLILHQLNNAVNWCETIYFILYPQKQFVCHETQYDGIICLFCRHGTCRSISGEYKLTKTPGRFHYHVASGYNTTAVNHSVHFTVIWLLFVSFGLKSGMLMWIPTWFTQTTMSMHWWWCINKKRAVKNLHLWNSTVKLPFSSWKTFRFLFFKMSFDLKSR